MGRGEVLPFRRAICGDGVVVCFLHRQGISCASTSGACAHVNFNWLVFGEAMSSDSEPLIGTWKLVSCFMEDVETNERKFVWGDHPNGYIVLTAGGRWIVLQTAEGRKVPETDKDRTAAFRSMLAYSGKYRTEGNKIIIKVDIAWDESWTGTEQVRYYRIDGCESASNLDPWRNRYNALQSNDF
jgi:Lipocalin-like domain